MNPIIRRELLEVLRRRGILFLQLGPALACALLVLARWPTGETADLTGARSLEVLRVFGYGLLACMLLLVPAFPAASLVRERVRGTLALLLNSPMSPTSIYLGKLGGALGLTAILLVMTLPAAAACHALGGTAMRGGIGTMYVILALAALQFTTLGLFVSSRTHSVDGSLRITYGLVLALSVATLAPHALLRGGTGIFSEAAAWLRALSPIPPIMDVLGHGDVGSHGMSTDGPGVIPLYMGLSLAMSLICAVATVARLTDTLLDRARPAGVMTEDREKPAQTVRRLFYLVDPQKRSSSLSLWINPIMVKEFRTRRFGRSHWTLRLIALCGVLSLGLSYVAASGALGWGIEMIGGALVLLQVALLILFAPSLASGLISSERESGSWQLLRMTPLSPGKVLRGKLLSVVWPLLLLSLATLPGYVVMMLIRPELAARIPPVLVSLGLTATFAVLFSATIGSAFRSAAVATTVSYAGLLLLGLGPLLIWLGREAPFGHATVQTVLLISPVASALNASQTPGFTQYDLLPLGWWIAGLACLTLLLVLAVRTHQLTRPE